MPTKKKSKTAASKKSISSSSKTKIRRRQVARHRTFRITKKETIRVRPLPGIKVTIKDTFKLIFANKRLFFGLTFIYALLQFIFAKGLGSAFDIAATKNEIDEIFGEDNKDLETSYSLFNYMIGSFNGQVNEAGGVYQLFISILVILATIWLSRQLMSGENPKIRDGFYKGMYPLVPFILVLLVISLQLIPALVGNFVFSTVLTNGLAVTFLEKLLWFLVFAGLLVLSIYMVLSSVIAMNIVSLPDMKPLQALRSARELVLHRRAGIFARIIILPILGLLLAALLFIPMIMFLTVLVEPLFLLAASFGVVVMTVYMYNLYRKLL